MSDEIDRLWALKELDEQLVEARAALVRFPEQRRALEARAATERHKLEAMQARLTEAQKKRRELEREVEATGEQERKFSSQLPLVKKNEEYQALLHEIAGVKARRSEIETQVLLQMDAEEGIAREKPAVEQALKTAEAELAGRRSEIDSAENAAQQRVDGIQARRDAKLAPIAALTRARYERVHQQRAGVAVVAILKGACGGCYRGQPPQVLQEARKRDRIITCEGCGRMLIWPPEAS
ncbi:MAG: C4-type zinc ribbon domain-containing protein [Candidatus Eisenbacteria bacterium]